MHVEEIESSILHDKFHNRTILGCEVTKLNMGVAILLWCVWTTYNKQYFKLRKNIFFLISSLTFKNISGIDNDF